MQNTNEKNKKRFDDLEAFAFYISTLKGSGENLRDGAFLRGNRGFFWEALDNYFKSDEPSATQVVQQQIMENQLLRFDLDDESGTQNSRLFRLGPSLTVLSPAKSSA